MKYYKKISIFSFFGLILFVIACGQNSDKPDKATEINPSSVADQTTKIEYKVTFIELGSVRCIPCQKMQPVMKSIKEKYGKEVNVVFHDVWTEKGQPYGVKYGIEAIPTQVFLDEKGKEYFRHVGFFPEEELEKVLHQKGVKLESNN